MFQNEIFSSFRIKTNELLSSTVEYVTTKFKQSKLVLTTSSAYGQLIFVLSNMSNLIFYYIEDAITELNIRQATRLTSVHSIASIGQYQPTRAVSAIGEIQLVVKENIDLNIPNNVIIIPNYSKLICSNNKLNYLLNLTQDSLIYDISPNKSTNINIIQGVMETQGFTGTGAPLQSYGVQHPRGNYIDNEQVKVFVNEEEWPKYNSLLQIPRKKPGFMVRTGVTSGIDVFFGNDYIGEIPKSGTKINVEYLVNDGWAGVAKRFTLDDLEMTFEDTGLNVLGENIDLNEIFDVYVSVMPDFGYNPEPTNLTRLMLSKTNGLLVVEDDYELLFRQLQQYSTVRVFTDTFDPRIFNVFLIPDINLRITTGETYFNIPEDRFLLSENEKRKLLEFVHKKGTMIVGNDIELLDPILKRYILNIALTIFDNIPDNIIKDNIIAAIVEYFLNITRRKRIPKSDLIALIEGINGVDSVSMTILSEVNENNIKKGIAENTGIDEFNDIIITDIELPIIRGGWTDRNGTQYDPGLSEEGLGAINIKIKEITSIKNKDYR